MAYNDNYHWTHSPTSPTYFPTFSPDSSPRSASSTLNYGSGSDFSASSAHSSRTSHGTVYINGHKVDIPTSSSSSGSRRAHDGSEPRRQHRRPRRQSTVIINADEIPRPGHHSRHGSHTSFDSHGSRDRTAVEPENIYVEENVGDSRPPRALIYDNRGRTRHRSHGNPDVQINMHSARRSRSRRQHRSASRVATVGRVMSWSDEEDAAQPQVKRKSSMKRAGSRRGRGKSVSFSPEQPEINNLVSFSPEQPEIIDLAAKMEAIQLQNQEIDMRPAVPDSAPVEAYYRPQVTARTYHPADMEADEQRAEQERLQRLRRRQDPHHPPITRHEKKKRRNSITAPPIGVFNPLVHPPQHY